MHAEEKEQRLRKLKLRSKGPSSGRQQQLPQQPMPAVGGEKKARAGDVVVEALRSELAAARRLAAEEERRAETRLGALRQEHEAVVARLREQLQKTQAVSDTSWKKAYACVGDESELSVIAILPFFPPLPPASFQGKEPARAPSQAPRRVAELERQVDDLRAFYSKKTRGLNDEISKLRGRESQWESTAGQNKTLLAKITQV